jgi:hypothetical protein
MRARDLLLPDLVGRLLISVQASAATFRNNRLPPPLGGPLKLPLRRAGYFFDLSVQEAGRESSLRSLPPTQRWLIGCLVKCLAKTAPNERQFVTIASFTRWNVVLISEPE